MHCSSALTDHAAAPGLHSAIVPRPLIATIAAMRCLEHTISVIHYWRPRLCRVFLHSAKSPLHSAKALPSVALGKVRSAKFFSTKGLCRVLFIRALGKIKKNYRVLGAALGKIFSAVAAPAVNGYFAKCPTQHSANFFFKKLLCRVPQPRHSAKFFFIFF